MGVKCDCIFLFIKRKKDNKILTIPVPQEIFGIVRCNFHFIYDTELKPGKCANIIYLILIW